MKWVWKMLNHPLGESLVVGSISVFFLQAVIRLVAYPERPFRAVAGAAFEVASYFPMYVTIMWVSMVYLLIMYTTNQKVLTRLIWTLVLLFTSLAEGLKFASRNEVIYKSDLSELIAIKQLLGMVNPRVLIVAVAVMAIFIFVLILIAKKNKFKNKIVGSNTIRWVMVFVTLFIASVPIIAPRGTLKDFYKNIGFNHVIWSTSADAQKNGPIILFLESFNVNLIKIPEAYSQVTVNSINKKYSLIARQINTTRQNENFDGQTVIYVLSESLMDPANIPSLQTSKPVLSNIHRIQNQSIVGGTMISSGFGGGTANVEYMALTGVPLSIYNSSMMTPYSQLFADKTDYKMESVLHYFDESATVHPFEGSLYNRRTAYKSMGMQKFYTTDSETDGKLSYLGGLTKKSKTSDENAYKDLLQKINNSNSSKSQFLQLLTMQNHMPYPAGEYKSLKNTISSNAEQDKESVSTYLTGAWYTDGATKKFIDKLNDSTRPVTVVFYGDHWPAAFDYLNTPREGLLTHQTPFFIWKNKANNTKASLDLQTRRKVISPSDFNSLLLESTDTKVTPYFALQKMMQTELPPTVNYIRSETGELHFLKDGKVVGENKLTNKQKQIVNDFKTVLYDGLYGKNYLENHGFYDLPGADR